MAASTTSRRAPSHAQRAANQNTSGQNVAVLAGVLDLTAKAPSVTGRGRQATIDPQMVSYIQQILDNDGVGTVTSPEFADINAKNSHDRRVDNAAAFVAKERGLDEIKISRTTVKGKLPVPANAKKNTPAKDGVYPLVQVWFPYLPTQADATK